MPTLVDRDLVLYESRVIMEYLDERFPHPPLLPVYPVTRAQSRLFMYRIQRDWCGYVDIILAGHSKESVVEKARKELRESLIAIAPIFSETPFFMNEEFTLVDCCVVLFYGDFLNSVSNYLRSMESQFLTIWKTCLIESPSKRACLKSS